MELTFLTKMAGACAGRGEGTNTKTCLGAGAGGKRQSCHRPGPPAARAWGPEAEAAPGLMAGPLGHHFPEGLIFSSHNITAQCAHPIQKLVDGVIKKYTISGQRVRFR